MQKKTDEGSKYVDNIQDVSRGILHELKLNLTSRYNDKEIMVLFENVAITISVSVHSVYILW